MIPRHARAGRVRSVLLPAGALAVLLLPGAASAAAEPPSSASAPPAGRPAASVTARSAGRPAASVTARSAGRSTASVTARSAGRPAAVAHPRAAVRVPAAVRAAVVARADRAPAGAGADVVAALGSAPVPSGPAKTFVALGDSYSSGPGLAPSREPGCGRSTANWASDVAAIFGLGPEGAGDWADYSCAGATAADGGAVRDGATLRGQIARAARDGALGPGTEAIAFTAGGNDRWVDREHASLYDALRACVRAGTPCGPARRVGPLAQLLPDGLTGLLPSGLAEALASVLAGEDERDRWLAPSDVTAAGMVARLRPAVEDARRRAPDATVAVVGYPRVVPPAGSPGCSGPLGLVWGLDPAEVVYLDGLLGAYDRAQRAAVAELDASVGRVRFVDLRTPSTGHDLCSGRGAWVNAPVLAGLGFGGGSLHPTADGMDRIAGVVAAFARATGLAPAGR